MTMVFYLGRNNKVILSLLYTVLIIAYFRYNETNIIENMKIFLAHFMSLIIVLFYNGERGKKCNKYIYVFYPVHMLIIYLIRIIYM